MKKIIALLVVLTVVISCLASCGGEKITVMTELPEGMSGTEAASLILANQRLNSQLLKNSNNIFESGSETLMEFSEKVTYSLASNTVVMGKSASDALSGTVYKTVDGSYVEIDGNVYTWGGFTEYSNSYQYFMNLTNNISGAAQMGARLIDDVKKYVRVVDRWVDVYGEEYYLHVEENSETLYRRMNEFTEICRRTKAEDGTNTYEIARVDSGEGSMRMVYSEGKICEYSFVAGNFNHNFLAVNNKGFWEVVDVGAHESHYNVSCMVIKNDICYDAIYSPDEESRGIGTIKVISSDRKTDIINFMSAPTEALINVSLQAFEGYQGVRIEASKNKIKPLESLDSNADLYSYTDTFDNKVYITVKGNAELVLDDGRVVSRNDVFAGGKVMVASVNLEHFTREPDATTNGRYGGGYVPTIEVRVFGDGFDEQMANLEAFLEEAGLVCTRDIGYVKTGIVRAWFELEQFVKHHEWNESPIYTVEDLARGWQNNLDKHASYAAMYEKIKDSEVIDFNKKDQIELAIKFAEITAQNAVSVTNNAFGVNAVGLELTVGDTMLFVTNEEYVLTFALLGADGTLTHIESNTVGSVKYNGEDSFTVKGDATFNIPTLSVGDYVLVAYISTADGIRTSAYTKLAFSETEASEKTEGNLKVSLVKGESNELIVKHTTTTDIDVILSSDSYTAKSLYDELSREIYKYGFIAEGASLEVKGENGSWITVTDDSVELSAAAYRLKYNVKNGEDFKEGYAYTVLG